MSAMTNVKHHNDQSVFGAFLLLRILSVFIVRTWFVPDEYWQSLEVAHKFVFGYGYLTWEWREGIRSYIHPGIIAIVYKTLQLVHFDNVLVLIYAPRLLQSLLSAFADYSFWKWCGRTKWSIFCIASAWFWFYNASRTLVNTFETCMTMIALSKYPFRKNLTYIDDAEKSKFLWFVAVTVAIRPTAAILWFPLCAYHVFSSRNGVFTTVLQMYLPVSFIVLVSSIAFDSVLHGSFIVTWWEFLKWNLVEGIGEFYGSHSWHWYLSRGFAVVLGVHVFPFLFATVRILRYRHVFVDDLALLASATYAVFVLSCLGHKEFRFLLPILPIALHISAEYLTNWSRKASQFSVWIVATFLLVGNAIPAVYFSVVHQRGNLDVMKPLAEIAAEDPHRVNILFLMPCHSTPLYSYLHQNVSVRFLTCNPNLSKTANYQDESAYFYQSPNEWICNNYPPSNPLPTHIVAFDALTPHLSDILSRYKPIHRIANTDLVSDSRVGRFVIIHELISTKSEPKPHN